MTATRSTTATETTPVLSASAAWQMCGSKHTYRSFDDAVRVAVKRARHTAYGLRPYPCPLCGGWHLTSKPNRRGRREIGHA